MAFLLRNDAITWFKNLGVRRGALKTEFDIYYLCLMMGLAGNKKGEIADTKEIVRDFVEDYKPVKRIIGALAFLSDLDQLGITLDERKTVHDQIKKHFSPEDPSNLTDTAQKSLNQYASGGFSLLSEKMEKPHHTEFFLMKYHQVLGEVLEESQSWG